MSEQRLGDIEWSGRQPLLKVSDAAERLGVHPKTLRSWIKSGYVPVRTVGPSRSQRVLPEVVQALAHQRRMENL